MKRLHLITVFTLIFVITLSIFTVAMSYADDNKTIQGNVVCLMPD